MTLIRDQYVCHFPGTAHDFSLQKSREKNAYSSDLSVLSLVNIVEVTTMSRIHHQLRRNFQKSDPENALMCPNNPSWARKIPALFSNGPIHGVVFNPLRLLADNRGWLVELHRQDELPAEIYPVMSYISETLPGKARGPHEHAVQTDYFAFIGPGDFILYLWDIRSDSPTWGNRLKVTVGQSNKQVVIIPPGVVHAYKNTGILPGWLINLPNKLYAGPARQEAVDEIRHENSPDNPFILD